MEDSVRETAGASKPAQSRYDPAEPIGIRGDDWFRSYDEKTCHAAACGSEASRNAIQKTGQAIAPPSEKRRLTFEEQLALVASGRARIVEWGGR